MKKPAETKTSDRHKKDGGLTMIEAMIKVMGSGSMSAQQIAAGLKKVNLDPESNNLDGYISSMLSTYSREGGIFVKVSRGTYRVDKDAWIRAQPKILSANDVVRTGKAIGFKLNPVQVNKARQSPAKTPPAPRPPAPRRDWKGVYRARQTPTATEADLKSLFSIVSRIGIPSSRMWLDIIENLRA